MGASSLKEVLKKLEQIPVRECGEPLDPVVEIEGRLRLDRSQANRSWLTYDMDFRLRRSVNNRLCQAAAELPPGISLLIKEALRPLDIQKRFRDDYIASLKSKFPSWTPEQLEEKAWEFVAPVEFAVHPTGAAVDLTLCDESGVELDMGTRYDADPVSSHKACYTAASNITAKAKSNRQILIAVMSSAGFYNFPYEWWHWSYGDREWALSQNRECAIYGLVA